MEERSDEHKSMTEFTQHLFSKEYEACINKCWVQLDHTTYAPCQSRKSWSH